MAQNIESCKCRRKPQPCSKCRDPCPKLPYDCAKPGCPVKVPPPPAIYKEPPCAPTASMIQQMPPSCVQQGPCSEYTERSKLICKAPVAVCAPQPPQTCCAAQTPKTCAVQPPTPCTCQPPCQPPCPPPPCPPPPCPAPCPAPCPCPKPDKTCCLQPDLPKSFTEKYTMVQQQPCDRCKTAPQVTAPPKPHTCLGADYKCNLPGQQVTPSKTNVCEKCKMTSQTIPSKSPSKTNVCEKCKMTYQSIPCKCINGPGFMNRTPTQCICDKCKSSPQVTPSKTGASIGAGVTGSVIKEQPRGACSCNKNKMSPKLPQSKSKCSAAPKHGPRLLLYEDEFPDPTTTLCVTCLTAVFCCCCLFAIPRLFG